MKRLIISLILLAGFVSAQTNYVVATKLITGNTFWVVPSATMPISYWTNSTLWFSGASPVLNAGATNAQWVCFAKTCSTMNQPVVNSQPTRVFTNGVIAARFDGVDDFIACERPAEFVHQTGRFRVMARVYINDVTEVRRVMNNTFGGASNYGFVIDNATSTLRFILADGSTNLSVNITRPSTNGWNTYYAVGNGTNVVLTVNGSSTTGTYARALSNTNQSDRLLGIGKIGFGSDTSGSFNGLIDYIYITGN